MARKRKKRTIPMKRNRKGTYQMKRKSTRRTSSRGGKSWMGSDFQGIAFAGIGYSILSRVVRSVIGSIPQLATMGNIVFPIAVLFINNRFFGNSYISVLAINELSQTVLRQAIPSLNINGDDGISLYGDALEEPYQVSGDMLDEPYQVSGETPLGEDDILGEDDDDLAGIGMSSPKDYTL